MNRLEGLGLLTGVPLMLFALWARIQYGAPMREFGYLLGALVGLTLVVSPLALPRIRFYLGRWRGSPADLDCWFRSDGRVELDWETIEEIAALTLGDDGSARRHSFPEGEGRTVRSHFQVGFLRIGDAGRLVIAGPSDLAGRLREEFEARTPLQFEQLERNPFVRPPPIRGAPRVLFAFLLVVGAVVGVLTVADATYESDTYNPLEETALVYIDLRASVDPTRTPADARLARAAFMTDVLAEEAIEIRWSNGSAPTTHASQALAVRRDIRTNLDEARAYELTPAQQDRASTIERESCLAARDVIDSINRTISTHGTDVDVQRLRRIQSDLSKQSDGG